MLQVCGVPAILLIEGEGVDVVVEDEAASDVGCFVAQALETEGFIGGDGAVVVFEDVELDLRKFGVSGGGDDEIAHGAGISFAALAFVEIELAQIEPRWFKHIGEKTDWRAGVVTDEKIVVAGGELAGDGFWRLKMGDHVVVLRCADEGIEMLFDDLRSERGHALDACCIFGVQRDKLHKTTPWDEKQPLTHAKAVAIIYH